MNVPPTVIPVPWPGRVSGVKVGDVPSAETVCVPTVQLSAPFTSGLVNAPWCRPGANQAGGGDATGSVGALPGGFKKFWGPYGMFAFWLETLVYENTATCWPPSVVTPS